MRRENGERKVKYALVLSGGGFKGAFQLGALNYINDNWEAITGLKSPMKFDIIAGVSVGAVNGVMIAANKLGELNELWRSKIVKNGASEIYTSDFIDTTNKSDELKMKLDLPSILKRVFPNVKIEMSLFQKLGLLFSKSKREKIMRTVLDSFSVQLKKGLGRFKGLADNAPLQFKLGQYIHQNRIKNTDFLCGFVSLDTGKYHSVSHNDFSSNSDFINGVVASAAIPMVFAPVPSISFRENDEVIISKNNIDGGVKNVSPLGDVVKRINSDKESDYKVIIINCHSGANIVSDFEHKNIAQIATRSLYEIAFNEIFNNDVKHFLKINDLVNQCKDYDSQAVLFDEGTRPIKSFESVVIQRDSETDLGNGLVANERLIRLRTDHGKMMAKKRLEGLNNG